MSEMRVYIFRDFETLYCIREDLCDIVDGIPYYNYVDGAEFEYYGTLEEFVKDIEDGVKESGAYFC